MNRNELCRKLSDFGQRKRSYRFLYALIALCALGNNLHGQSEITMLERIAVKDSPQGAYFVLKDSETPFFVKGFNYVRLRGNDGKPGGDHATFEAATAKTQAHYDPQQADEMFAALRAVGYNTVRVFIIGRNSVNPGIAGEYDSSGAVYAPYMDNFIDFLKRATRHRIRVFPTFGDGGVPRNAYYKNRLDGKDQQKNLLVLTQAGIDARVEHITSFLNYIKEREPTLLPTLLGVQCQNEAYLKADQWPFTVKKGEIKTANGRSYDMADTSSRQALMDEGYHFYHEAVVRAVKAVDPAMLVAEGVFVPRAVGKDPLLHAGVWPGKTRDERYPPLLTVIGRGALDFVDVHFYRTSKKESVEQSFNLNLGSAGFFTPEFGEIRKSKPVIIGEFGAFDFVEDSFEEAVASMTRVRDLALRSGVNGMLFWTYDGFEQKRLYHAASNWKLFVDKMGDFETPPKDSAVK